MLPRLKEHIESHGLIKDSDKLAIAVSGGKDSVCAAHLFNALQKPFVIVHCNFQLRGAESDGDQAFVESLSMLEYCEEVLVRSFDTSAYAKRTGLGTQEAARTLRYQWFDSLHEAGLFDILVTAHHMNDNVETFLINTYRVSGLRGLAGIPEKREYLVRPLLPFRSEEIATYLKLHNITYREDSSNASSSYLRNRLRNNVLPVLERELEGFSLRADRSIGRLSADAELFSHFIQQAKAEIIHTEGESYIVDSKAVKTYPQAALFLYYLLDGFGFNHAQCEDILSSGVGARFDAAEFELLKDRGRLIIAPITDTRQPPVPIVVGQRTKTAWGTLEIKEAERADFASGPSTEFAAKDLENYALELRLWEEGDYIYPLGMPHKKLLSDFFIDQKVDRFEKHRIPLLVQGKEVLWVIGMRLSDKLKLQKKDSPCYRLSFTKKL